jgi:mono/diheme cytochrome c family protein
MRLAAILAVSLAVATAAQAAAEAPELDPLTGLKMTGDWQLVRNNCVGCHSAKLITQQSGTESRWLGLIRWMQQTQNLWQFEPEVEKKIIGYLAANYPPQADRRRAPIPTGLMPPNPYAPPLQDEQ